MTVTHSLCCKLIKFMFNYHIQNAGSGLVGEASCMNFEDAYDLFFEKTVPF